MIKFLGIFDPTLWSLLLNKDYVNGHLANPLPLNCPRGLCITPFNELRIFISGSVYFSLYFRAIQYNVYILRGRGI